MEKLKKRSPRATGASSFPLIATTATVVVTIVVFTLLSLWFYNAFRLQHASADAISRMQYWRGQVLLLDERLTMSARMAVASGDKRWVDRYEESEPELDQALHHLERLSSVFGRSTSTQETDAANGDLVAMERAAFQALSSGRVEEASDLLFGPAYLALKRAYAQGMDGVLQQIDVEQARLKRRGDATLTWNVVCLFAALALLATLWMWYGRLIRNWRVAALAQRSAAMSALDDAIEKEQFLAAELSESQRRLDFILDNCPLIVYSVNADGLFEYANGAGLGALGLTPGEVDGDRVWDRYRHLPVLVANMRLAIGGSSRHFVGKTDAGHYYENFLFPVARTDGRNDVVGVSFDVTESAEARKIANMLGEVLQHSPVGTAWIDARGCYRYVNKGFCEISTFSESDLIGQSWDVPLLKYEVEGELESLQDGLSTEPGQRHTRELKIKLPDGGVSWLKINAVARRLEQQAGVILTIEDVTRLRQTESKLSERTYSDAGTGLPNRLAMIEWLRAVLSGSSKSQACTGALIHIDLDHFRRIHDVLGRLEAERLLREVAGRLRDMVPTGGMLSRIGGDEFALYTPAFSRDAVSELIENIRHDLSVPLEFHDQEFTLSASFGAAMLPEDASSAGEALRGAEAAVYLAKQHGRNCLYFFEPRLTETPRRLMQIETRLRAAIRAEQLEVHYQPIMRLADSTIVGCEALLRWNDEQLGAVPPADFIPVAEELNLTSELTQQVINTAARDLARWNRQLDVELRVAINCSAQQLDESNFCDLLLENVKSRGLKPDQFELEVTERVVMSQSTQVSDTISRLLTEGFRLAIDDFGTGYSALAYLKRYPFHTVKIDRSFISDISNRPADEALCRAIIGITDALHMDTVAEGLETRDQVNALRSLGSGYGQGYYFAAAMPADRFLEWVTIRSAQHSRFSAG